MNVSRNAAILIQQDKYDSDAWTVILNEVKNQHIDECRSVLEHFLSIFPTAARYWKLYIDKEMDVKHFDRVEKLFPRCLFTCLDVELWKSYINYIKIVKAGADDEDEALTTAYQFVLKHVGQDVNSSTVWLNFVNFLKNRKTKLGFEDSDKFKLIREVYQQAIVNPMNNVEQLWREYDIWENANDKNLAKGLLSSFQSKFQTAKIACRQRKQHRRAILLNMLARPPRGGIQSMDRDYQQVLCWKKLISYEQKNQQRLTPAQLKERVTFTYKQALLTLRHYPEIWHSYAMYVDSIDDTRGRDDAITIYNKAIEAMPDNILIHFLYAEYLESSKMIPEARIVYDTLMKRSPCPMVFIQYQRFSRRCESMEKARKIFMKARKSEKCSFHVYVAAAMMEYLVNKDVNVANKIFQFGLPKCMKEPEYVLQYLNFLTHRNDSNNLRVVFERVLSELESSKSDDIWEQYIDFQHRSGDLKALKLAEKRRTTALGLTDVECMIRLIKRFGFLDCLPCSTEYLHTLERAAAAHQPDLPMSVGHPSHGRSKKYLSSKHKTFPRPDLEKMFEYKPGTPFLKPGRPLTDNYGVEVSLPELPQPVAKLLKLLPPREIIQGIPIGINDLMEVSTRTADMHEMVNGASSSGDRLQVEEAHESNVASDLYQHRRRAQTAGKV